MLKIYFGDLEDSIYGTRVYFDNVYEDEWIESELAAQIIKDIDKLEPIEQVPPLMLCGGTKTLLLMLNRPDRIYNGSMCGDNCAKWMIEIGKLVDVTINFYHLMNFGRDADDFDIEIINNGIVVHNMTELAPYGAKFLSAERERNRREVERIDREEAEEKK